MLVATKEYLELLVLWMEIVALYFVFVAKGDGFLKIIL